MRPIKCIVNFFCENFPLSIVFCRHSAQQWFDEFTIKIFNLCQKTIQLACAYFQHPIDYFEGETNKKHTHKSHTLQSQKSIRKTAINTRKWCNSFGFCQTLSARPHKKIRASIFMRCDIFVKSKEFQSSRQRKQKQSTFCIGNR